MVELLRACVSGPRPQEYYAYDPPQSCTPHWCPPPQSCVYHVPTRTSDKQAHADLFMVKIVQVRCQCLTLRCVSVRISSGVYSRLGPCVEASGILYLISSCVNKNS